MASIDTRTRKDGRAAHRVMFRLDGKQKSETFVAADTTRDAEQKAYKAALDFARTIDRVGAQTAVRIRNRRTERNADPAAIPLLKTYFDTYLGLTTEITDGTKDEYRRLAARTWMPYFGEMPIDAITRDDIKRWINAMGTTHTAGGTRPGLILSSKSRANAHGLLSTVLTAATYDELIPGNVARGIGIPRQVKEEHVFLTASEFAELVSHVQPHWQPLVIFLAGSGLRWGEATCLRWAEVDTDSRYPAVRVIRAYKKGVGGGRVEGAPKTARSKRTVDLAPELATMLRTLRASSPQSAPNDRVFNTANGNQVLHQNFHPRVWAPAVSAFAGDDVEVQPGSRASRPRRHVVRRGPGKRPRIHDLRHTFAALQIAAEVPMSVLQRQMGHESISTTIDVYGHLERSQGRRVAHASSMFLTNVLPELVGDDSDDADKSTVPSSLALPVAAGR